MKENTMLISNGLFVITGNDGNILDDVHGLYAYDTRFIKISKIKVDNLLLKNIYHMKISSKETLTGFLGVNKIGKNCILLLRKQKLNSEKRYIDNIKIINLTNKNIRINLKYLIKPSFDDIFEVRGYPRFRERNILFLHRGNEYKFLYNGIDNIIRGLKVRISKKPSKVSNKGVFSFNIYIKPSSSTLLKVEYKPFINPKVDIGYYKEKPQYDLLRVGLKANEVYEKVFASSLNDLLSLTYITSYGPILLAGIPNFACVFGRDLIISSLFLLPFEPKYAKAALLLLSKLQGKKHDPKRDEEPGRILHELRVGELSCSNMLPFNPYYGSIDSTPLYLILACEYYMWTGDIETIKEIKDNIEAALNWIYYKLDEGEGFIRYVKKARRGLDNQGWKDSGSAIIDKRGKPLKPPIALVEVQGYTYKALNSLLSIQDYLKLDGKLIRKDALKLKERFNRAYWLNDLKYYALALDRFNLPSRVVTSNPGHLLFSGIAYKERAIAERLFKKDMFSGWGIRTLSSNENSYDPFSYHNGSVWPHDNAIIALGLSYTGFNKLASILSNSMFMMIYLMKDHQAPELVSGIDKEMSKIPVPIPTANKPQAWSAASVFAFLTSMINMKPDIERKKVILKPSLPKGLKSLKLKGIKLGNRELSFQIFKNRNDEYLIKILNSSEIKVEIK